MNKLKGFLIGVAGLWGSIGFICGIGYIIFIYPNSVPIMVFGFTTLIFGLLGVVLYGLYGDTL